MQNPIFRISPSCCLKLQFMPALQALLRTLRRAAWASHLAFALLSGVAASQAATYYIDYNGGNDSNSGTSKSAPWKHCPAMEPFSGSYTHQDGDRFIFKGGVTWPRAAVPLYITVGGAAGNHDYYGVDKTWFAGASWTRPVFTSNGLPFVNFPFDTHRENMIRIYGSNSQYVTIDNLHITGWAVTNQYRNNTDGYGINVYSSGNVLVTNCYIGNWTPAAPQDGGGCLGADWQVVGFREAYDCILEGPLSIDPKFKSDPGGVTAGNGARRWTRVQRCDISRVTQGAWDVPEFWDNSIHDSCRSFRADVHENGIRFHGNSHTRGNQMWNIYEGVGIFIIPGWNGASPRRAWTYNNVFWNVPQLNVGSGDRQTAPNQNESWFVNNIIVDQSTGVDSRNGAYAATEGPVVRANNIFINDRWPLGVLLKSDGTPLQEINSNNVVLTHAQAGAAGMTAANGYKPTQGMSLILDQGLNFSGNPLGVSSLYPLRFSIDHDNVSRPQGNAWDIGAYELSGTAPTAPANLRMIP
jgi:hypothetical protein